MKFLRNKLENISVHITDGEHRSVKDDSNGEYYLLSNKNIIGGKIVFNDNDRKITQTDFEKINKRTRLENNDVVISTVGSIGKTALIKESKLLFDFQRSVGIIKTDKTKLLPEYLLYYLNISSVQKRLNNCSKGAVQKCLFISDLKEILIDYPESIIDQRKTISILSSLDAKIEINNKINQELEARAKTLYDYWFVQFDFPNDQGKPYKLSGGKIVYKKELNKDIPESWEVKKIGKVCKTALGGTPSTKTKDYWQNGEFPWLNSGEVANFPIIDAELSITEEAIKNSATKLMPKGTVLLSITRHIRPSILAIDACANQSVVGIYETEYIKSSYLYPFMKNEIPRYLSLRTGAQQPHINKETIDDTFIIIPTKETLKEYYDIVNPMYELINNKTFQNQQLTKLRDWLLPMLMNGQVTVGEAQEKLDMAAEAKVKYNEK